MAKLCKGKHVVETKLPTEITRLKSHGYKVIEADQPAKTENKK